MSELELIHPATSYAAREIQKLNQKYQDSLNHRLQMRQYMISIVKNWLNVRISISFKKWKNLRFQPTFYQNLKKKWFDEVRFRRRNMQESILNRREKFQKKCQFAATMTRNSKKLNAMERLNRQSTDIRAKTVFVSQLRQHLVEGNHEARKKLLTRNKEMAREIRSRSAAPKC
ncbi:unnamed protein product [Blepharisma stoltei]|uniref:Uncharacterized protein n=1 Tax=Blepharisma stoltei TaxID=1481888 RepID=A0AAU9JND4_9CILI|nr:unnamed protein product [Blepharisma stoltei]